MKFLISILSVLIANTLAITDHNETSSNVVKQRESRQFNSQFYPENFGDDDSVEFNLDGRPAPPYVNDRQSNGFYKKNPFDKFPGYGYAAVPSYGNIQNYNGNPFLKMLQADQTEEVMLMMNDINRRQSSEEGNNGLLSNLDPSVATAIAAIIPLSIILFAVIPVLMNLFQNGPSVVNLPSFSPVTTIANSRLGRALMDKEFLEERLQDIVDFAVRALEEGSCVQQTVCHQVLSRAGKQNAKTAVTVVDYFGKKSWIEGVGAGRFMRALEKGDCGNVCGTPKKVLR